MTEPANEANRKNLRKSHGPELVVAILATHNRVDKTVSCLTSYFEQETPDVNLRAVMVDGGSQDGTPSAVEGKFEGVEVIRGGTDLYWAGAMWTAEQKALKLLPDYLLWLNDDVLIDEGGLQALLRTATHNDGHCLVVGAMRDPESGDVTYSGIRRPGLHPMRVQWVQPTEEPQVVDTFNGNLVLVSTRAREIVGPIDGRYVHSGADYDYGYRAKALGVPTILAAGTLGECSRDGEVRPWANRTLTRRQRFAILRSPKGHPFRPRGRFMRRHAGWLAPFFLTWLYLRAVPDLLAPAVIASEPDRNAVGRG